jgi:hypothetical protein
MFSRNVTAIIGHIKMTNKTAWAFLTVQQFTTKHTAFTNGGIRSLIFNENTNGLASSGAIIRIGRKVLINENKFFAWVEAQNGGTK